MPDLIQDKFVTLCGLRFHYREVGDPGLPPLVLLHGFTSQGRSWDACALGMADRYRVLALDQRGHGETEWATDYAPERMVEDIAEFAHALGLWKFALVGLSMGGRNAYAYAAQYPQAVTRLVIVDIGPDIVSAGSERIRASVQAPDVFDTPEVVYHMQRASNPYASDDDLRQRVYNNMQQLEDGQWTWRYDKALRSPATPLPRPDPEQAWASLARIPCPTLIIRGSASDVFSRETAERMVQTMPDARWVEVSRSGHNVVLDNLPEFLRVVREFLA